jgi:hypothetical protein
MDVSHLLLHLVLRMLTEHGRVVNVCACVAAHPITLLTIVTLNATSYILVRSSSVANVCRRYLRISMTLAATSDMLVRFSSVVNMCLRYTNV